ncbi:hypothetical protein IB229_08100 [Pseudomonas sp. PDM14]|uniref:hypothetical protein n=1 Tax=Pseudomonas sp. PDM14 TaxID=2769288 RepID=UPI00178282F0|nr:hypothetical protein [Pseudomonas sp. PDM14]MBD9482928.1 hypothetical protein [Pseudomonas sp. PDM14]
MNLLTALTLSLGLAYAVASPAAERSERRTAVIDAPQAASASCARHQAPRIARKRQAPAEHP